MREATPAAAVRTRIDVVAAVIIGAHGEFLLAQRPHGKVYAGYWEFPGGKVEPGEDTAAALARELHEELGIEVELAYPWLTRDFDYAHADVRLHFYRVVRWSGELHGRELQQFAWQSIHDITVAPLLPANGPILRALQLPDAYGISCAGDLGRGEFMRRLERAVAAGLQLIEVREKSFSAPELAAFTREVVALARPHGARVLVNGPADIAAAADADGIHLTSARLMAAGRRPDCEWCAASCHDGVELAQAQRLGVDFVVLGPVMPTPSHPDATPIGWQRFGELIRGYTLPVYALGGMREADLAQAWGRGAHGVAMVRGAWSK